MLVWGDNFTYIAQTRVGYTVTYYVRELAGFCSILTMLNEILPPSRVQARLQ